MSWSDDNNNDITSGSRITRVGLQHPSYSRKVQKQLDNHGENKTTLKQNLRFSRIYRKSEREKTGHEHSSRRISYQENL